MRNGMQFFLALMMSVVSAQVLAIKVVVSIPPLAAMVSPLLDEDDEVVTLLTPGASPHGFQLKPSHIQAIQQADLVIRVGTGVDAWLEKALLNYQGMPLVMMQQPGLVVLNKREGGVWDKHSSHAHGHEHAPSPISQTRIDGHIWLSLNNARVLIKAASQRLQDLQPERLGAVQSREQEVLASLAQREWVWGQQLASLKDQGFIVMHDAYQYFEQFHGLQAAGTIHVNPEIAPSIKRLQELRATIQARNVVCVFKEPQFPEARLRPVVEGLQVNIGELDPLGSNGVLWPYEAFYDKLVQSFVACFE